MKVNKQKALIGIVLFLFVVSALDKYIEGVRYIKYLIPPVCFVYAIVTKTGLTIKESGVKAFVFLAVYTLLMVPLGNQYGLHDVYFYLTFLSPFVVGLRPSMKVKNLFILFSSVFFITQMANILSGGFEFSLMDSKSTFEDHTFAFVIGLFAICFLVTEKKSLFIIALVLAILSLKRISLLAIIVCGLIYFLTRRSNKPVALVVTLALTANILYIFAAYFVATPEFSELSQQFFGVNASQLTMGRNVLYSSIFHDSNSGFISKVFGHGAGDSYILAAASIFNQDGKVNLHSDILKIYYELGLVGLCFFISLLYTYKTKAVYLAVYINVIFLTDNVSTYPLVMFVFFVLCAYIRQSDSELSGSVALNENNKSRAMF
ncbi:O-antigen ligase family protein [Oceanisphaera psychrotolerans]|uniref:O-antigen ligase-related domain-containing protein n=1 Tax=Oceanisphaera psychrotolerans TaxID=1414654 RepID=A0A1J4QDE0_9GAMM|nr:O-antigen ligase family protein [Oceanisphaera psychrotolerans]OIN07236.1 hypothetical protein BFR47_16705 [Oceanisphaera psychrotolerans]